MSSKNLAERVKGFKNLVNKVAEDTIKDIDEAEQALKAPDNKEKKSKKELNKDGKYSLKETAPMGSFEFVREQVSEAIESQYKSIWPEWTYGPYVMYVFPESIICSYRNDFWQVPYYMDIKNSVTFGKPEKVDQYFAPSMDMNESLKKNKEVKETKIEKKDKKTLVDELREANIKIIKEAKEMEIDFDFMPIREGSFDPASGTVEVILIEAGTNPVKKRHYPDATIEEAAPLFSGLKMYVNHPTRAQEAERPERDLRDWVSTIVESYSGTNKTNGRSQAIGKVAVHDDWLRERLNDPVARQHIGLSINTGGKVSYGKVNGEEMQIVEKIILAKQSGPASVDWVTEAGARGRVSRLLKESAAVSKEKKSMELKEATLADLLRENPQLAKDLKEAVSKDAKSSEEQAKKDLALKEANDKIAALENKEKLSDQKSKVAAILKESKLPEVAKTRIQKEFETKLVEGEKELKEAVGSRIKEELEYLSQFDPKGKIKTGSNTNDSSNKSILESTQSEIENRLGLNQKKEEDKTEEN